MKEFAWGLRYFLLLFKKSYPIVVLLLIQAVATIGVIQGREMLAVMNQEPGYFWANVLFTFGTIFTGVVYFVGTYWLLFFSTIRANLFDSPEYYNEFHLKIRAAEYHDFMEANRHRIIHFYAGLLLMGPWFFLLLGLLFVDGTGLPLWISFFLCTLANGFIFYARKNRTWILLKAISSLCTWFDFYILKAYQILSFIIRPILFKRKREVRIFEVVSLTTEAKVHSVWQANAMHRGGFFGLVFLAMVGWIGLMLAPNSMIQTFGALSCLLIGFGFWAVVIVFLEFMNKRIAFPLRFGLFCWLLFCSWVNPDTPVRTSGSATYTEPTQNPSQFFDNWLKSRIGFADSTRKGFFSINGSQYCKERPFPVIIVCAEGGASRSGYWTAAMLQAIWEKEQDSFDRHLFAISSVSGGSFGSLVYVAGRTQHDPKELNDKLEGFFSNDFLAPITNRLVGGGPLLWMSPAYIPSLDRAFSFEKGILEAMNKDLGMTKIPSFQNWKAGSGEFSPLLIVNAVEAETGKRAILSNHNLNWNQNEQVVNINQLLKHRGLDLAGAIHIGARFPVFSPSASLTDEKVVRHHFVDGGYYDNVGYETAHDLIRELRKSHYAPYIRPMVFAIINSYENAESLVESSQSKKEADKKPTFTPDNGLFFLNEPLSIVGAVAHIRSANTKRHWVELVHELDSIPEGGLPASRFYIFDLKAVKEQIPLNWRLSPSARNTLKERVKVAMTELDFHPKYKSKISLGLQDNKLADSICRPTVTPSKMVGLPQNPKPGIVKIRKSPTQKQLNISPATHPSLYYYSVSRKKYLLKSEADFPISKLKRWNHKKKAP